MTEETILVQDLQVNFKTQGSGPVLLILHGWGSNSDRWLKAGEIISEKGLRVIAPDLPGFGKTEMPPFPWALQDYCNFLAKFVEALNLEKFYLLGHSFGGTLAVKYSLRFSEKIEKLFLVAPAGIRKESFKKKLLSKIAKMSRPLKLFAFYNLARKVFYKFIVRKSDYTYLQGPMRETYLKIISEDISALLGSVKNKTILIWGEKDDVVPSREAYIFKEKIKNSKLVFIKQGKHDLERKMPEILAEKILTNLQSL